MALMDNIELVQRFIRLALPQRKAFFEKLASKGMSLGQLPVPMIRHEFEAIPLSYAQHRQWFLWQLEPESAAYHVPAALRLRGVLDVEALQRSFQVLIERHESLRTRFVQSAGQTLQVITPEADFNLPVHTLEPGDAAGLETRISVFVEAQTRQLFDLQQGPLLRVCLLRVAPDEHVLVLTQHHIVSDGWSMQVLVEELVQCYAAFTQGHVPQLPALAIQYADYAIWQRHWMEAGERDRQLAYWTAQLGDLPPVLELPTDKPRPLQPSYRGERLEIALDASLGQPLKTLAQREGVTLFMVLLASFQLLLHRYSGQRDVRVGVPVANRNRPETKGLIGFFVNTQVLKAEIDGQMSFRALLAQVKQAALGAQEHQELPFEQLVEALHPERSLGHNPLFQVMYNHQSEGRGSSAEPALNLPQLTVEGLDWKTCTAQFDLTLDTAESAHGLSAALTYATDVFTADAIERLAQHWQNLLRAIITRPHQAVGELPLLAADEHRRILRQWNPNLRAFDVNQCLHHLIEAQAERTPDALAVSYEDHHLTYGQLNADANLLAYRLIEAGVGPDVLVGLSTERSLEMLVGLLAVLKAGGAYVPMDPGYPQDRLHYMMQDSGIALLLAQSSVLEHLAPAPSIRVLALDNVVGAGQEPLGNPQVAVSPDNLAYVIYTSGSTGQPKGVLLPHRNVVRLFSATDDWFRFGAADVWTLFHSCAFDFSVWELFGALTYGARLVVVPHDVSRSTEDFYALLCREQVTVLNQTPSAFKQLVQVACAHPAAGLEHLRYVVFGGEALEVKALQPWFEHFGDRSPQLINMYGITETTVHVTYRPITRADLANEASSPIGEPIVDLSWYLLDAQLNPVPEGCIGELYVGQAGLARGYLHRGDLTASRFIPDPFRADGARLYRTGDLARLRAGGVVEYVGRIDHQVKIRGFRIELGEIEAQLLKLVCVREVAVLARPGVGGQQLLAYIVPAAPAFDAETHDGLRETIRQSLKAELPDYMIPAHVVFLPSLPLTVNGKLDRQALPEPELQQQSYEAPCSELEQQVALIWEEVLGVERVGRQDDFFELGGHSLLATQVVSRVRHGLELNVPLKALFEHTTLQAFAQVLNQEPAEQAPAFVVVDRGSALPLSYAQERQWFLWQLDPLSGAYNIPTALRLAGVLDVQALQSSFDELLVRHETLRTTFVQDHQRTLQVIHAPVPLAIVVDTLDAGTDPQAGIAAYVQTHAEGLFDLQTGPLLRVKLLRLADDDHVLVLTQHHIVSDGWSMQLMVQELVELYGAFSSGRPPEARPLPIQYADYAAWQRQWMEAGERERQLAYWTRQLAGDQPLQLPLDYSRPAEQSFRGAQLEIVLQPGLGASLLGLAQQLRVTPFMLLLASFQTLLHRYSGQSDIRVGVPIANRNRVETERLIGFFVNTQVLKADVKPSLAFADVVQQVRQTALEAQAHQDLPFEQLVEALHPERSLSHSPLFQVMFNHQSEAARGQQATRLPGLAIESLDWASHTAQFDLVLNTFETGQELAATLTYATDLFAPATVERLAGHWQNLLRSIVADYTRPVAELSLLGVHELELIERTWNANALDFPRERCIHQQIQDQVQRTPDALAVIWGDEHLTYRQLNGRANALARKLVALGVGPEVRVGVAMPRSAQMVVALLAVLKAGGAYVPLDPDYPAERVAYMLKDSQARVLLTQAAVALEVDASIDVLFVDAQEVDDQDLDVAVHAANLAYVIYTSGSTGLPKGVAITHRNVAALTQWSQQVYSPEDIQGVLASTSICFDLSVWELFVTLAGGGFIVGARNALELPELAARDRVRLINSVPSAMGALQRAGQIPESVRIINLAGEPLKQSLVDALYEHAHVQHVYDLYGPSEDTTYSTWTRREAGGQANIGKPLANTASYLLDAELHSVPVGVAAELYLAGEGITRGYLLRPGLTAEKFVPNPFST
ncbi:amino acid adenylation domain-containing protein, partial [Pseudomonas sp. 1912-s]|uniref:non-ribosomal peptide synthetase n=1 Tax=Pseudomonas sp. 1912-s TaxID=3033802 RepID=UPI0023DFDF7A